MCVTRLAMVALLGLPLAGCFALSVPPKPLPDWAMNSQAEPVTPARVRAARMKPVRSIAATDAPDRSAAVSFVAPASVPAAPAHTPQADVKPFSPEWQAREDAFDNKLRRTMDICRGC